MIFSTLLMVSTFGTDIGRDRVVKASIGINIVADEDIAGIEIGDNQFQAVDEFDGSGRITRRISPDERGL